MYIILKYIVFININTIYYNITIFNAGALNMKKPLKN